MSNKIDVFSTANSIQEEDVSDKIIVVIDVLRASSTIVTALENGARGIIPVEDMEEASKIAQNLDASRYLLCGEKDGKKIEGYHLGNSPLEFTKDKIADKTLIFNTTNGTKAITRANLADKIIIGSFLNLMAVVNELKQTDSEIILLCAGWKNRLSLEDALCAGNIVYDLMDGRLPEDASDGAKVAFVLYEKFKDNVSDVIQSSNHAVRLKNLVSTDDVTYCGQVNIFDTLPVFNEGIITDANNGSKK
jgi:2-phosphosulfolactate phosphatase